MSTDTSVVKYPEYQGRGGPRPNSGRKPDLAIQLAKAEKLAKDLKVSTKIGLHRLARGYDGLMESALEIATGFTEEGDPVLDEDGKPKGRSSTMIQFLLNLPVKLVEQEDAEKTSGVERILKRVTDAGGQVNVVQNNYGGEPVPRSGGPVVEGTWRDVGAGAGEGPVQPGEDNPPSGG
jgi:hypothetical protein